MKASLAPGDSLTRTLIVAQAFPRASYAVTDDVRLRIGYLAVGGTRSSLFGEFGRNDEVVFQLRYSF